MSKRKLKLYMQKWTSFRPYKSTSPAVSPVFGKDESIYLVFLSQNTWSHSWCLSSQTSTLSANSVGSVFKLCLGSDYPSLATKLFLNSNPIISCLDYCTNFSPYLPALTSFTLLSAWQPECSFTNVSQIMLAFNLCFNHTVQGLLISLRAKAKPSQCLTWRFLAVSWTCQACFCFQALALAVSSV